MFAPAVFRGAMTPFTGPSMIEGAMSRYWEVLGKSPGKSTSQIYHEARLGASGLREGT